MESSHAASVLVTTSPVQVGQRLADVETWTRFLIDVGAITKVAHERYDFQIVTSKHVRTSRIAVKWHLQSSSFVWTSLHGPCFEGSIRLTADEGGWTRVNINVNCWPEGFVANVADLVMPARHRSGIDEAALRHLLEDPAEINLSEAENAEHAEHAVQRPANR